MEKRNKTFIRETEKHGEIQWPPLATGFEPLKKEFLKLKAPKPTEKNGL